MPRTNPDKKTQAIQNPTHVDKLLVHRIERDHPWGRGRKKNQIISFPLLSIFSSLIFYLIICGIFFLFCSVSASITTPNALISFCMGQTGGIASGRIGFSVLLIDGLIFIEHSVLPAEPKVQHAILALVTYVLMKNKTKQSTS